MEGGAQRACEQERGMCHFHIRHVMLLVCVYVWGVGAGGIVGSGGSACALSDRPRARCGSPARGPGRSRLRLLLQPRPAPPRTALSPISLSSLFCSLPLPPPPLPSPSQYTCSRPITSKGVRTRRAPSLPSSLPSLQRSLECMCAFCWRERAHASGIVTPHSVNGQFRV